MFLTRLSKRLSLIVCSNIWKVVTAISLDGISTPSNEADKYILSDGGESSSDVLRKVLKHWRAPSSFDIKFEKGGRAHALENEVEFTKKMEKLLLVHNSQCMQHYLMMVHCKMM